MRMSTTKIPKILIIDDDPFIVDMYVLKFTEQKFSVETASDGKEGLKKIKEYQPDIVLLDIVMPGMDGFGVLEALKDDSPHACKIVLLTNIGQKSDIDRGMGLGASDYIVKAHFTPSEVVTRVRALLRD